MRNISNSIVKAILGSLFLAVPSTPLADAKPTYVLQSSRQLGQTDRVVELLEVGGDVLDRDEKSEIQRLKMSVVCDLRYDEKTLQVPSDVDDRARSIRHYHKATAVIKIAKDGLKPVLRPERRLVGVAVDPPAVTLFCPRGTLSRDELDVIDVLANSLLLDRLLPENPVAVGDSWKHSEELLVALLGLDAVSKTDVQSVLTEVTESVARMELSGRVQGALEGVSTEIELKAKYRLDRKRRRIDWLGLLVKEHRGIGYVKLGVDLVARLQVQISPITESPQLSDAALKDLPLEPTAQLRQLTYESPEDGWQFTYDRCWHITSDHPDLVVLRMIDRGELLAQCNVSPLPKQPPGRRIPLSEFQQDVRQALGKGFGEFVEASQWGSEQDYQVYRVVVRGEVSELPTQPIHWDYYLVADEQGHRVAFVFTVESSLVKRFSKADERLVRSLRFLDPEMAMHPEK